MTCIVPVILFPILLCQVVRAAEVIVNLKPYVDGAFCGAQTSEHQKNKVSDG